MNNNDDDTLWMIIKVWMLLIPCTAFSIANYSILKKIQKANEPVYIYVEPVRSTDRDNNVPIQPQKYEL